MISITRSRLAVREPDPVDVAPTHGRGRARGRARGHRRARGEVPSRGQATSASLESKYESKGPTRPVLPPLATDPMLAV